MRSFISQLLTRGYEAVSVADIIEGADVGRSTFYLHFKGKKDLLGRSLDRPSSILASIVDGERTPEELLPLMKHFAEQRDLNGVFFRYPIRALWSEKLASLIAPRIRCLVRRNPSKPLIPHTLAASVVADLQISILSGWLVSKPATDPLRIAELLLAGSAAIVSLSFRSL